MAKIDGKLLQYLTNVLNMQELTQRFWEMAKIFVKWLSTAVRLQRFRFLHWPLLPKPQQLTAACCLCCPRNVFIGGLLVSLVRSKRTLYNNVIGQLLIQRRQNVLSFNTKHAHISQNVYYQAVVTNRATYRGTFTASVQCFLNQL